MTCLQRQPILILNDVHPADWGSLRVFYLDVVFLLLEFFLSQLMEIKVISLLLLHLLLHIIFCDAQVLFLFITFFFFIFFSILLFIVVMMFVFFMMVMLFLMVLMFCLLFNLFFLIFFWLILDNILCFLFLLLLNCSFFGIFLIITLLFIDLLLIVILFFSLGFGCSFRLLVLLFAIFLLT